MSKLTNITILLISLILASCSEMFDYSPYVIDFEGEDKNVNATNLYYLSQKEAGDTIRIAFIGDTHRAFDEFDEFIHAVNDLNTRKSIDFTIHVGDIADFGLPKQYIWGNSMLLNLDTPYLVCLGNHDLVGNGGLAYSEMFGPYNFSFVYDDIKFIFINTNGLEYSFNGKVPDINWLDSELQNTDDFSKAVVVFHVPPTNVDFDPSLVEAFHLTIAKYNNVLFTSHGHLHHHDVYYPFEDSIPYVNVYGIEHGKYNVIEITDHQFKVDTYEF